MEEAMERGRGIPPEILAVQRARAEALRGELLKLPIGDKPVLVEFGCGHGHWLTSYAEAFDTFFCLGVDLISARIRMANAKRDKRGLAHLHFIKAEAKELLSVWPEAVPIASAFMLFPDPWPKKRHFKNRMIQPAFLEQLAARMSPGAHFHYRTDHPGYFAWTRQHLTEHPMWHIEDAAWPWSRPAIFNS